MTEDTFVVDARLKDPAPEYQRERFPLVAWWLHADGDARAWVLGLGLLSVGFAAVAWPLGLIVPGAVITLDVLGLNFERGER